jgi:uracil-DNA glycosylase
VQFSIFQGERVDSKSSGKYSRAEAWLRYADDLGLGPFHLVRAASNAPQNAEPLAASMAAAAAASASAAPAESVPAATSASPRRAPESAPAPSRPAPQVPVAPKAAPAPAFTPQSAGASLFEERIENDSLDRIREDITPNCTRCKLHKARTQIVFGVGDPQAQLVFVGEGPGRDEDEQGEPFVGRAGKLLTQMIEAMSLRRQDVYICNVVKCRPPENRLPEKDEIATCSPFLIRQLSVIQPKVICCLGACSAQTLLNTNQGISRFRGEWFDYRGAKLIATYHPAYLLRNPAAKAEVWKDLQKVMAVLGLEPKRRKTSD